MATKKLVIKDEQDWTIQDLYTIWGHIDRIATEKYGLTYAQPQIEIITSEQMLENYLSHGLPGYYSHWSFGKKFLVSQNNYIKGQQNLAFELVINSDPVITYIMQDNNMQMQACVLAHACVGHAGFFKNNYLFKENTNAKFITTYLQYMREFIEKYEAQHGIVETEEFIDALHCWDNYAVFHTKRKRRTKASEAAEQEDWEQYFHNEASNLGNLGVPESTQEDHKKRKQAILDRLFDFDSNGTTEENILYWVQAHSPVLSEEEREFIRIFCNVQQYFFPQIKTKIMNEGWASFWDHTIMTDLYDEGILSDGGFMECISDHCLVCGSHDQLHYLSNPYTIGYNIFMDIRRMCEFPTAEDYVQFPDIAGKPWLPTMIEIMETYNDDSFLQQFLSRRVIEKLQMYGIEDDNLENYLLVVADRQDDYYDNIKDIMCRQISRSNYCPQLEVLKKIPEGKQSYALRNINADLNDPSYLHLLYIPSIDGVLDSDYFDASLCYLTKLWGHSHPNYKIKVWVKFDITSLEINPEYDMDTDLVRCITVEDKSRKAKTLYILISDDDSAMVFSTEGGSEYLEIINDYVEALVANTRSKLHNEET